MIDDKELAALDEAEKKARAEGAAGSIGKPFWLSEFEVVVHCDDLRALISEIQYWRLWKENIERDLAWRMETNGDLREENEKLRAELAAARDALSGLLK